MFVLILDGPVNLSPDSDPASDRGSALVALLACRGSLLPPSARGLLPRRFG